MIDNITGILVVDKPKGPTSHDIVSLVRKKFGAKKAGHAGTLDPAATGVLVILLGKATKLSRGLLNQDKEYEAVVKLGEATDSGDADGRVIWRRSVKTCEGDIKEAVKKFVGEINQVPPMFSAKKIGGKKLYELARRGERIKREPVRVTIKSIEVGKVELPFFAMKVVCGKGTYIRQLAEDIGEKLGTLAHLASLRRTRSGDFDLRDAITVESLVKITEPELRSVLKTLRVSSPTLGAGIRVSSLAPPAGGAR